MFRVVLDTNVIISAVISPRGTCADILRQLAANKFVSCFSSEMLEEINRAIRYEKNCQNPPYTKDEIWQFLKYLYDYSIITEGKIVVSGISSDPDDNKILACALEAGADFIVSGDDHLLSLGQYENIPILRPADFMRELERIQEL